MDRQMVGFGPIIKHNKESGHSYELLSVLRELVLRSC